MVMLVTHFCNTLNLDFSLIFTGKFGPIFLILISLLTPSLVKQNTLSSLADLLL